MLGFLMGTILISLPLLLQAQLPSGPRIVILTDAAGLPNTPLHNLCETDMGEYASTIDISANETFCVPFLQSFSRARIQEVFKYMFCNAAGYNQLVFKIKNTDQAANLLSYGPAGLRRGNLTELEILVDLNQQRSPQYPPGVNVTVTVHSLFTEISLELDYELILAMGPNTDEIHTSYDVFTPALDSPEDLVFIKDQSAQASMCLEYGNPNRISGTPVHSVDLYPNPAQDRLSLSISEEQVLGLKIIDFQGKSQEVKYIGAAEENQQLLDISHLPPGFYLLRIQTASGWITQKWVKA